MKLNKLKKLYFWFQTFFWSRYASRKAQYVGVGLRVNFPSRFTSETVIGTDCHFNGMEIVGSGSVSIGDHFHSGSDILIITQNHNYDNPNALPYDELDFPKKVQIGKNCWLGSRVTILPGTIIEDGVVVQAGAVLFGRIPKYSVVGGNPWKIIKFRNIDKYDELEKNGVYVAWKSDRT